MRLHSAAVPLLVGLLAGVAPAFADSVSVSSSSDGTTIVNGKPCRVVTLHDGGSGQTTNSTSITSGANGLSGSTTVSPGGGNSSSVTVGSGSASSSAGGGSHSSSAASSDCVIYRHTK